MLIYGTVDFGLLLERACVVWGTLWGWLYSAPWGSFPLQNAKSQGLPCSTCYLPHSEISHVHWKQISDFLQTRKFIRKIRNTFFEVRFPNFQMIWWHSFSSSKFWFLAHFSVPMDMQGLRGSEPGPLPLAFFLFTQKQQFNRLRGARGMSRRILKAVVHFLLLCLIYNVLSMIS